MSLKVGDFLRSCEMFESDNRIPDEPTLPPGHINVWSCDGGHPKSTKCYFTPWAEGAFCTLGFPFKNLFDEVVCFVEDNDNGGIEGSE